MRSSLASLGSRDQRNGARKLAHESGPWPSTVVVHRRAKPEEGASACIQRLPGPPERVQLADADNQSAISRASIVGMNAVSMPTM